MKVRMSMEKKRKTMTIREAWELLSEIKEIALDIPDQYDVVLWTDPHAARFHFQDVNDLNRLYRRLLRHILEEIFLDKNEGLLYLEDAICGKQYNPYDGQDISTALRALQEKYNTHADVINKLAKTNEMCLDTVCNPLMDEIKRANSVILENATKIAEDYYGYKQIREEAYRKIQKKQIHFWEVLDEIEEMWQPMEKDGVEIVSESGKTLWASDRIEGLPIGVF